MSKFHLSKSSSYSSQKVKSSAKPVEFPEIDPSTCSLPEAFYHDTSSGKDYVFRVNAESDRFIRLNLDSLKRQLRGLDYSATAGKKGELSEIETLLNRIQIEHRVAYAGPLAGHRVGLYQAGGENVLVTDPPSIIEPKPGDWTMLDSVLENMFGEEQQIYFLGWLKVAFEALRSGNHRAGQALFIAGPVMSGKSLLQQLISVTLGGEMRVAHPYQYMTGVTTFNSDLFRAEHLVIDDHPAIKTTRERQSFTDHLKEIINPQPKRCHGKGVNAITLSPFWRLTISINDTDANLAGFLHFDESVADKLMLFKTRAVEMPMPTHTDEQRRAFFDVLQSQLPHMLHTLIAEWEVPEDLRSPRFGITHFHHPDILASIEREKPEERLLEIVDAAFFSNGASEHQPWEGLAAKLENDLRMMGYQGEIQKLLTFSNACGSFLAKLEKSHPRRVRKHRVNGRNDWRIFPPLETENHNPTTDEQSAAPLD